MSLDENALTSTDAPAALARAGQVANAAAAAGCFTDYRERKAPNTLRRQATELARFADFLAAAAIPAAPTGHALAHDPPAWRGVTWGLVAAFVRWLLGQGYAVGTVNLALSTVKTYAGLAASAGVLDPGELVLLRAVRGYGHTEGQRVDAGRPVTRTGAKKAQAVPVTPSQAAALKRQPATAQGRRDALLICLLLDHGLRVGELARLTVADFDLAAGELRFYRPKVAKTQTHRLTPDTLRALRAYIDAGDAPAMGPLLRASRKGGALTNAGLTARAITGRVRDLGAVGGLAGLSAHDLRHAWATRAARNGTPVDRLQDAGGWASPAMPLRYVAAAQIANEGVRLDA
ncbi:MAG: tyrosine-type recombinase/integrase [Chloroflexi bacterium]|nr:tyrosine-type recombinase/integrase [Chloroflexota bacterium]